MRNSYRRQDPQVLKELNSSWNDFEARALALGKTDAVQKRISDHGAETHANIRQGQMIIADPALVQYDRFDTFRLFSEVKALSNRFQDASIRVRESELNWEICKPSFVRGLAGDAEAQDLYKKSRLVSILTQENDVAQFVQREINAHFFTLYEHYIRSNSNLPRELSKNIINQTRKSLSARNTPIFDSGIFYFLSYESSKLLIEHARDTEQNGGLNGLYLEAKLAETISDTRHSQLLTENLQFGRGLENDLKFTSLTPEGEKIRNRSLELLEVMLKGIVISDWARVHNLPLPGAILIELTQTLEDPWTVARHTPTASLLQFWKELESSYPDKAQHYFTKYCDKIFRGKSLPDLVLEHIAEREGGEYFARNSTDSDHLTTTAPSYSEDVRRGIRSATTTYFPDQDDVVRASEVLFELYKNSADITYETLISTLRDEATGTRQDCLAFARELRDVHLKEAEPRRPVVEGYRLFVLPESQDRFFNSYGELDDYRSASDRILERFRMGHLGAVHSLAADSGILVSRVDSQVEFRMYFITEGTDILLVDIGINKDQSSDIATLPSSEVLLSQRELWVAI